MADMPSISSGNNARPHPHPCLCQQRELQSSWLLVLLEALTANLLVFELSLMPGVGHPGKHPSPGDAPHTLRTRAEPQEKGTRTSQIPVSGSEGIAPAHTQPF